METRYARIRDEEVNILRKRLGIELPRRQPYIEVITKDAIKHFANGIGDTNPLWTDEEYAQKTKYKSLVAPPCILYSTDLIVSGNVGGLPGVHAMFAGTNWEWFLPIKVGDHIVGSSHLSRLEEKQGEFAGRTFLQGYETTFRNQRQEIIARAESWCIRSERDTARKRGKYNAIRRQNYTEEQLKAIEANYDQEEIRGSQPRYWEAVEIGDELVPIVKGPLTITDMLAWLMGWGGLFIRAHRRGLEYRRQHPAAAIPDSFGIPDVPERVHWDNDFAQQVGAPGAYDYGPQRISWLGQLMTNWMGDGAFLKKLDVQVRRFNIVGDTTWCKGKVINKYIKDDGSPMVECQIWAENQRGETTARGKAIVILPTQNK